MVGIRMLPAGEQGLVVEFGREIDADVNARVHRAAKAIVGTMKENIVEVVPTYRSLLVYFNPLHVKRQTLIKDIENALNSMEGEGTALGGPRKVVTIPVCYGGEFGPDIEFVAQHNKLSVEKVITIHSSIPYLVYMIGFTPGFPYLGGMSEKIATPRLAKPRTCIPAGSVGIAGSQTGLYPIVSPGGWQLIGRTPIKAFDKEANNPFLFEAGNYLKFQPITPDEYYVIEKQVVQGEYRPVTELTSMGGEK